MFLTPIRAHTMGRLLHGLSYFLLATAAVSSVLSLSSRSPILADLAQQLAAALIATAVVTILLAAWVSSHREAGEFKGAARHSGEEHHLELLATAAEPSEVVS